jgi:phosphohistidine swiveling domain-containing protein
VILTWEETFRAGPARCGGKGYHLARLHRYGFTIPRGGVLPADIYTSFIRGFPADRFATLPADRAIEAADELSELRRAIEGGRLPDDVRTALRSFLPNATLAIRSSAVAEDGAAASFAGIHDSVLDVRDSDQRERAVLHCFASLWTPRAIAYRRAQGIPDAAVPLAVVLCEMVPSVAAGVAFSCDPRTGRRDVIVIDSARGSGERVVSGAVNPDHVELRGLEVLSRATGAVPALTPGQEVELARIVERIHWSLGDGQDPQDVEWAHDGSRFWILQSRPATRIPRHTFAGAKSHPLTWSTANIKDAVPGVVSMLAWSLILEAIEEVLYAIPKAGGYPIPPGMQVVKRIEGRGYFDLTAILWCLYDFAGIDPKRTAESIGGHQPTIPVPPGDPLSGPEGKRRKKALAKLAMKMILFPRRLERAIEEQFRGVRELLAAAPRDAAGVREALERLARMHATFNPIVGIANGYSGGFHDPVLARLRPYFGGRAERLITRLAAGAGGMASAEQGYRIEDLAAAARLEPGALENWKSLPEDSPFRRELGKFLADFGHRAVYEADLFNPRWGDDPAYIVEQVRRHVDLEPMPRNGGRRVSDEAWSEVKRVIPFWKRPVLKWLLGRMRWGYSARENAKSALAASMWPARRLALETGRLMNLPRPELAFHLAKAELMAFLDGAWDGRGAAALAEDREARRAAWLERPDPPDVVVEGGAAPARPTAALDGDAWKGIAVSAGRVQGRARLVRHPEQGSALERGEILVAPSTDPGWTPLFLRAGGLVMETGGFLSHGAIVAREFGIPAVVNVPGVMGAAREGETLTVDGDEGRVYRETDFTTKAPSH